MDTVVVDPFFDELPRRFGAGLAALAEARDPTAWPAFERGELDEAGFLGRLYREAPPAGAPTPEQLRDAIIGSYRFVPGMRELLMGLAAAGWRRWVLSNYPPWIAHVKRQLDLGALFEGFSISCELGARKPHAEAYERTAEQIGAPAEELLLIDDRERNCEGARAQGWRAIRFETVVGLVRGLDRVA